MKNKFIRILAVIVVVFMAAVCIPVMDSDNILTIESSALSDSGSLGGNVKWSYDTSTKTLTVSGSGAMSNYSSRPSVFNNYNAACICYIYKNATKIVVNSGVTSIGNYAFYGFEKLTSVTIAASVKTIGNFAFMNNTALTSVSLNSGLTSIGQKAFYGCTALKSITIPSTVTTLNHSAFEGCTSLSTVKLSGGLKTIGNYCFKNTSYKSVTLPTTVTSLGTNPFANVYPTFTCSYGDIAYNFCRTATGTATASYLLKSPVLLMDTSLNTVAKQVKVTLKIINDKTGAGVNAGNFSLTYDRSALAPASSDKYDYLTSADATTVVAYNTAGKVSVAVMAQDKTSYTTSGGETTYVIAEILFNVVGQTDSAAFGFTADTLMLNGAKKFATAATSSVGLHSYSDAVPSKIATCREKGETKTSCVVCGKYYTQETATDPNNHTGGTEVRDTKTATCSATGYTGDTYCKGCNVKLSNGTTIAKNASNHTGGTEVRNSKTATCAATGYTGDTYCKGCNVKLSNGTTTAKNPSNHTGGTEVKNPKAATCGAVGYTGDTYCKGCNTKISNGSAIAATGKHTYTSTVTKTATCKETGVKKHTCSVCEYTYNEAIAKNPSNHTGGTEVKNQKAATCGAAGYTGDTCCKSCGGVITAGKAIAATGKHTYTSKITTTATCNAQGINTYTCSGCSKVYTEMIAKNPDNHSGGTEVKNKKAATCNAAGYTGDTYCKGCNKKLSNGSAIAATGVHTYTSAVTKAATCNATGVRTYTCTGCSTTYTEMIAKNASNHTGGTEVRNPKTATCAATGYTGDTYCKGCNVKISNGTTTAKNPSNHTGGTEVKNQKAATCGAAGYTGDTHCKGCGVKTATGKSIAATGNHSYTGSVSKEATCKATGTMKYTCSVCSKSYTETIEKNPNNHSGTTEIKGKVDASCATTGYTGDTYCKGCGEKIGTGSVTAKTDTHSLVSTVTNAATCSETGVMTYDCLICDYAYTETIEKDLNNHIGETRIKNIVDATCTTVGYSGDKVCAGCDSVLAKGKATDVIAHSYEDLVTEPTCTQAGYTIHTCTVCGAGYRSDDTEPLGHDYDESGKCTRCGNIRVTEIKFIENSGLISTEVTETAADGTEKVVKIIVTKTNSVKTSDFLALIDGEGWSITDKDGNAMADDSAVTTSCSISHGDSVEYKIVVLGDVNMDGKVNASDARLALRYSARLETLNTVQQAAGDVDFNKKVNASDARMILRVASKLDKFN